MTRGPWEQLIPARKREVPEHREDSIPNEHPTGQPTLLIDAPAMTNQTANRGGASNRTVESIDDWTGNTKFHQTSPSTERNAVAEGNNPPIHR